MASFDVMIFPFWHLLAVTLSLLYKQVARNFKMVCKNDHFRHILLFYFRKGKNAAQAANIFFLEYFLEKYFF